MQNVKMLGIGLAAALVAGGGGYGIHKLDQHFKSTSFESTGIQSPKLIENIGKTTKLAEKEYLNALELKKRELKADEDFRMAINKNQDLKEAFQVHAGKNDFTDKEYYDYAIELMQGKISNPSDKEKVAVKKLKSVWEKHENVKRTFDGKMKELDLMSNMLKGNHDILEQMKSKANGISASGNRYNKKIVKSVEKATDKAHDIHQVQAHIKAFMVDKLNSIKAVDDIIKPANSKDKK